MTGHAEPKCAKLDHAREHLEATMERARAVAANDDAPLEQLAEAIEDGTAAAMALYRLTPAH